MNATDPIPLAAETVRALEIVPRHAEMDELRQLRMRLPGELEKFFDLIAVPLTIVAGKKSIGLDDLIVDEFLETHFHHVDHQPMRQAGNAIGARPGGGT